MKKARFKIGQEFLLPQKHRREAVISDILTTTNASGVVVDVRYLYTPSSSLMGQPVYGYINETTVAKGIVDKFGKLPEDES